MWQPTARTVLASSNASIALWAVSEKAPTMSSSESSDHEISAAIMEACWWIAALDDLVRGALDGPTRTRYQQAQRADEHGRVVPGIRWARHRHSHQLAVATVRAGRLLPFMGGEDENVAFNISSSWRWHAVAEMGLTVEELHRSAGLQPDFEAHLARYPVRETFYSAVRWFNSIRERAPAVGIASAAPDARGVGNRSPGDQLADAASIAAWRPTRGVN